MISIKIFDRETHYILNIRRLTDFIRIVAVAFLLSFIIRNNFFPRNEIESDYKLDIFYYYNFVGCVKGSCPKLYICSNDGICRHECNTDLDCEDTTYGCYKGGCEKLLKK